MREIELKYEIDPEVTLKLTPVDASEPGDFDASVEIAHDILGLPQHPKGKPTATDVGVAVHFGKAYRYRLGDTPVEGGTLAQGGVPASPAPAPAIGTGGRATINVWDMGARDDQDSSRAFQKAVNDVRDGGKVFVPYGRFPAANVQMPGGKDIIIEGESELGSQIIGLPGKDIFVYDDLDVQRRLQNVPVFKNLMFNMTGNGSRGSFSRKTISGWNVGAAAIAFVQNSQTDDGNRKKAWGNSYVLLENVRARGDKDAIGATLLWSERALYGFRANKIFIGDHGTTVSGLQGGIILGRPRFAVAEYAPDEFRVESLVHWGGVCSIHVPNIANGAIIDHKAYACRHPLHLTGLANNGPRKRGRDLELRELYYDNDVVVSQPVDQPMVVIDADGVVLGTIHLKGSRNGGARPVIQLAGEDIEGGQFRLYDSSIHRAPEFKIGGNGHDFKVRAAGLDSQERATLLNGKASYPGVTVR